MENSSTRYCRVSTKEQEETGYSLPSQVKLLTGYGERLGLNMPQDSLFSVAESASGAKQRKVFAEMMAYVKKHNIKHLIVEKVDRLTRNFKEAIIANDWIDEDPDRRIHFVKNGLIIHKNAKSDEKFRWDIEVVLAKKYITNLSEEVKKGQEEKIAQGWLPTKPRLGYKTVGEKGHKIHVKDEDKAPHSVKMFELFFSGNYSIKALVETMYKEGLRSRSGNKVGKSMMHNMLTDPFYCGLMVWNGRTYPGKHEALITKSLFDAVQMRLKRKTKSPMFRKHLPVFKAKIDCAECGGTITWETHKGHWYGHCNHYRKCSQKKWVRQEAVESELFPLFDNVAPRTKKVLDVIGKALKESHINEVEYHTSSVQGINKGLELTQRRLEAIYEDKIDGKISPEFYQKKFEEYSKNREDGLEALKRVNEGNTKYYEAGFAIHELASRASEIYKSPKATVEDKRLLLSKIFSNLTIKSSVLDPDYTLAFKFLAEWVPVLNNTFEPLDHGSVKRRESNFVPYHPALLRG